MSPVVVEIKVCEYHASGHAPRKNYDLPCRRGFVRVGKVPDKVHHLIWSEAATITLNIDVSAKVKI